MKRRGRIGLNHRFLSASNDRNGSWLSMSTGQAPTCLYGEEHMAGTCGSRQIKRAAPEACQGEFACFMVHHLKQEG